MLVKKKKGKIVEAYCLGEYHPVIDELMRKGYIKEINEGEFEVFSQEAVNGTGEHAKTGDYIKIDSSGKPYPNSRAFFEKNHRKVGENKYEQIPVPLRAWDVSEDMCEEMKYLLREEKISVHDQEEEKYFAAFLWGTMLTAPKDSIVVFYKVERDGEGRIRNIDFNFVKRKEFDLTYDIIG